MSVPSTRLAEAPTVSAELLAKYNRPGPRYTSYPTAPEFSEAFGERDYREHLARADERADEPLSLYFHIPFCESMCTYCGCHVIISKNRDKFSIYLDHVERELALATEVLARRRSVAQLHFGGGTPTSLSEEQLTRLWGMIGERFQIAPGAEVALEVDPCVTTDAQVTLLRRLGFNRVSMGVQDFTHEVQVAVNRIQSFELTKALYDRCRELGFGSINLDLIYGLPHQTPDNFQRTLDQVISLRPDRVAVFNFAHVPWMKPHQRKIDEAWLPTTAMRYEIFARTMKSFLGAGYQQIGMDHFALPDDELAVAQRARRLHRNFMGYITRPAPDQVGFGVSAIGDVAGAYAQNVKWLNEYYQTVEGGRLPVQRGFVLSADDHLRRHVIMQLMCNFSLDVAGTAERFGIDFRSYFAEEKKPLEELAAAGFIVDGGDRIEVTPVGRVFIRNVCMTFDKYLRRPRKDERPLFSRTV
jgi:oxygen-independent coproporphyrinogen-3 oxidase